jgi:DNA primase
VTPSKNLWHCLGACGGGDIIQFIIKTEKVSFRHAVEILERTRGGVPPALVIKTRAGTEHPSLVAPDTQPGDTELLSLVVDFYHQTFLNQPQAIAYLQRRGVFHPEAVKVFRIGYANRTLGYRVPTTTARGKLLSGQLERAGIFRESGHEHLNGCVVIPIFNERNEVAEMYGRRIVKPVRGASDHLYLPGPHAGVWNADGIRTCRQWLLCEAIIDGLSFWVHGHRNVTASYGTNGFTPDHWALLRAVRPEQVVICYDNDEEGNKAANELAQQLEPEGVEVWRVEVKAGTDINDLVRSGDDPKNALASLLAAASRLLPVNSPVRASQELDSQSAPEPGIDPESEPDKRNEPFTGFAVTNEGRQAEFACENRAYRVRGLEQNTSFDHLKVNVRARVENLFHFDTFDLYNARQRSQFATSAAQITGVDTATIEADMGTLIGHLETHQEKKILALMKSGEDTAVLALNIEEERVALDVLRHPRLLDLVLADIHKCGLVGEETNILVAWLVSLSRKLDKPLGVCVMSRSAAGKSSLLEAIARFVPEEDRQQYSALTPQALFHMAEHKLQHKALFLAEDVGAEGAAYSLKTIQSDGKLVMACTMKDENTGHMVTKTKIVKGPLALFLTSTSRSIDDELLNRLLVLTINEGPEQTRKIHEAQRSAQTMEGIMERRARPRILRMHQNIQRLIRPLVVRNSYAKDLVFGSTRLRSRRDHQKYLDLINVMALVHQYQREIKSAQDIDGQPFQYIEVNREDIARVDTIMRQVLEQSTDELWPASRRMLAMLQAWAQELPLNGSVGSTGGENYRRQWTRREIRERTEWSDTQVRMVLGQLVDFEYVLQKGGGQGRRASYQLAEAPSPLPTARKLALRTTSQSLRSPQIANFTHA